MYSPVKKELRGNVRTDEDINVLVDVEKCFRESAKSKKARDEERKQIIDEVIIDKLIAAEDQIKVYEDTSLEEDRSIFDNNIIYHLSGFLCHRACSLIDCTDCVKSICDVKPDEANDVTVLTKLLDYGGLFYPTKEFFHAVSEWEKAVCSVLGNGLTNGDIILDCLKTVSSFNGCCLGCKLEGHTENLIKILLPYYVTMRVHFFTRSVRRALGKGKATKNKRKQSKLFSN